MKFFLAIFLLIHGIAHLVGFVIPWRIAKIDEMPYSTRIFFEKFNMGHAGIRIVGILWLLAAIGYFYSIYMVYMNPLWAMWFLWIVTVYSVLLSISGLPQTKYGLVVNAILFVLLLLNNSYGWIS